MKLQAKVLTDFLDAPAGTKIGILFPNQPVTATGNTQGLFTEVDPGGMVGWALTADLEPSDEDRLPLDREPPRDCRGLFGLSYAAMAGCSSMA